MKEILSLLLIIPFFCRIFSMVESLSCAINANQIQRHIKYVHGRRCQIITSSKSSSKINEEKRSIPLILMGGTAQSIGSWEHQTHSLIRERDNILIYECIGQGPHPPDDIIGNELDLKNYYKDVSLEAQADNLYKVVKTSYPDIDQVDVAGFSFGGRVALATMMKYPNTIRKLHITGVPAERDNYSNIIISSWKDIFSNDNASITNDEKQSLLKAFAWSSILSCYSPAFLSRDDIGPHRINDWVDFICDNNTYEGLAAILHQTHYSECVNNPWHSVSMAERIAINKFDNNMRLVVGENDILAPPTEVQNLASILAGDNDEKPIVTIIPNSGHAVPIEQPRLWRNDLLSFIRDE